jgi:hypothetical protein
MARQATRASQGVLKGLFTATRHCPPTQSSGSLQLVSGAHSAQGSGVVVTRGSQTRSEDTVGAATSVSLGPHTATGSQAAALALALKETPAVHGWHSRSDDVVGGREAKVPAAQLRVGRQKACPARG